MAATPRSLRVEGEKKILVLEKKKIERRGGCFPSSQKAAQGEIRCPPLQPRVGWTRVCAAAVGTPTPCSPRAPPGFGP